MAHHILAAFGGLSARVRVRLVLIGDVLVVGVRTLLFEELVFILLRARPAGNLLLLELVEQAGCTSFIERVIEEVLGVRFYLFGDDRVFQLFEKVEIDVGETHIEGQVILLTGICIRGVLTVVSGVEFRGLQRFLRYWCLV